MVTAEGGREDGWQVAQLREEPGLLTQTRRLDQIPDTVRDALTFFPELASSPETATILVEVTDENEQKAAAVREKLLLPPACEKKPPKQCVTPSTNSPTTAFHSSTSALSSASPTSERKNLSPRSPDTNNTPQIFWGVLCFDLWLRYRLKKHWHGHSTCLGVRLHIPSFAQGSSNSSSPRRRVVSYPAARSAARWCETPRILPISRIEYPSPLIAAATLRFARTASRIASSALF